MDISRIRDRLDYYENRDRLARKRKNINLVVWCYWCCLASMALAALAALLAICRA